MYPGQDGLWLIRGNMEKIKQSHEVEQLKEQEEIKTALKQATTNRETMPKPVANAEDKLWFVTYGLIVVVLLALRYFLDLNPVRGYSAYIPTLQRTVTAALFIVLALAIARSIRLY